MNIVSGSRNKVVSQTQMIIEKLKSTNANDDYIIVPTHEHAKMNRGMYTPNNPVSEAIPKLFDKRQ